MARILALDYGDQRIGVAITDETGQHVFPRPTITASTKNEAFRSVADLVQQEGVSRVVVGLPLTMRGERGPQAEKIQAAIRGLGEYLSVPIDVEDERLTSAYADRFADSTYGRDSVAAAAILESYLERARRQRS